MQKSKALVVAGAVLLLMVSNVLVLTQCSFGRNYTVNYPGMLYFYATW